MVVQASWLPRVGFDVHARVGLDTGCLSCGWCSAECLCAGFDEHALAGYDEWCVFYVVIGHHQSARVLL